MGREYRQTSTGLDDVAKPKIKVYPTIADMETALANGDLAEGEIVSTVFVDGAGDNAQALGMLADEVHDIQALIPTAASPSNKLVPQTELDRVERLIPADASTVNPLTVQSWVEEYIGDQLEPRDEAIAAKASQTDLTALANRVSTNETKLSDCTTADKAAPQSSVTAVDNKFANYETKTDATTFKNTINSYLPASVAADNKLITAREIPPQVTFSLSGTTLTITDNNP